MFTDDDDDNDDGKKKNGGTGACDVFPNSGFWFCTIFFNKWGKEWSGHLLAIRWPRVNPAPGYNPTAVPIHRRRRNSCGNKSVQL